jgi:NAD(P)-dependent dehydrogenase (short-subunit alcohol dehydrogenase family)
LVGGQQRRPQEIADLVEWVVDDADEWMTGQTLVTIGGSSLGWT